MTLYSTLLSRYTYDELKELCFAPDSNFGNVFDCEWGVWRDKAVADFGVSSEFFNLVPTLSGPQRYLQIATYVKLSPLSLAIEYEEEGVIEGVYEAFAGVEEGRKRRDGDMMVWFAQRVTPEEDEALGRNESTFSLVKREVRGWYGGLLKNLIYPPSRYDMHYLSLVIRHSRLDILDQILHRYFTLPEGFSIERDIPKVPFWEFDKEKTIYDLPLQATSNEEAKEYMDSCLSCADTRIVDFFRSLFRDRHLDLGGNFSRNSLLIHGKPEEAYGIALRFVEKKTTPHYLEYMVELVLHQGKSVEWAFDDLLYMNLGDVTFLQALLPLVKKYKVKEILANFRQSDYILYPLSVSLLQGRLQE